jgi:hypothetical protein
MEASVSTATEALRLAPIRDFLDCPGPCITIVLPAYHRGERTGSPATILKGYVQEAARHLTARGYIESAQSTLLQPLERLLEAPELSSGSKSGRVIFCSPSTFQQFDLALPSPPSLKIGGCFAIRLVTAEFECPHMFYILALSKSGVSLIACTGSHAGEVNLPPDVPANCADALALERPDHTLRNRSAVGRSLGSMHAVCFGTGSEREQERAHLADYYRMVDRGLCHHLHGIDVPLLLAGVDEDTVIYKAVSMHSQLVGKTIRGSATAVLKVSELRRKALAILREECIDRHAATLRKAFQETAPSRFSTDLPTILGAAFEGRVDQLYLDESAEQSGICNRGSYRTWGSEDLLNIAAVQTLVHHGKTYGLPTQHMPSGASAAALMRH